MDNVDLKSNDKKPMNYPVFLITLLLAIAMVIIGGYNTYIYNAAHDDSKNINIDDINIKDTKSHVTIGDETMTYADLYKSVRMYSKYQTDELTTNIKNYNLKVLSNSAKKYRLIITESLFNSDGERMVKYLENPDKRFVIAQNLAQTGRQMLQASGYKRYLNHINVRDHSDIENMIVQITARTKELIKEHLMKQKTQLFEEKYGTSKGLYAFWGPTWTKYTSVGIPLAFIINVLLYYKFSQ